MTNSVEFPILIILRRFHQYREVHLDLRVADIVPIEDSGEPRKSNHGIVDKEEQFATGARGQLCCVASCAWC